jgi:ATP-dependent protease ClpP protease subunit
MTEVLSLCQIVLSGKITDISVRQMIVAIQKMVDDGVSGINLCIDSQGGSARAGFELYDYIFGLNSKVPVTGIVTGRAESMALVVLQACAKRVMVRGATVLAHQISAKKTNPLIAHTTNTWAH